MLWRQHRRRTTVSPPRSPKIAAPTRVTSLRANPGRINYCHCTLPCHRYASRHIGTRLVISERVSGRRKPWTSQYLKEKSSRDLAGARPLHAHLLHSGRRECWSPHACAPDCRSERRLTLEQKQRLCDIGVQVVKLFLGRANVEGRRNVAPNLRKQPHASSERR